MESSIPTIRKSYRGSFPFKLATTSYIYPAPVVPNVIKLAPLLDEIEIVFYESKGQDAFPDARLIEDLKGISLKADVRFNIHLPIDVYLGDPCEALRSEGVKVVKEWIERTMPLSPSVYTLHFSLRDDQQALDRVLWRHHLSESAGRILTCGIEPSRLSIETLGYPYEWIEDIVRTFGFSICLDIGHLLLRGVDLKDYLERYLSVTSIVHLHGTQNSRDHLGIDRLTAETLDLVFSYLQSYQGILSIEVFTWEDLRNSLRVLDERWKLNGEEETVKRRIGETAGLR